MSWTARVLAPVALIATALVVAVVVADSIGGAEEDESRERTASTVSSGCEPSDPTAVENGYYVLDEGETLSTVAASTCVELEEIERLNPNLDPQALPPSGCVDLVVDGCKALAEG